MIRKILVPLDGSATAERILPHVVGLVQRTSAQVLLVHMTGRRRAAIAAGEAYLAAQQAAWRDRLGEIAVRVVPGRPDPGIVDTAVAAGADLIAMTTHARTGLRRVLFGSVANAVLARSPLPLFLAQPHIEPAPIQTLLAPMDGSSRAELILPYLKDLGHGPGVQVTLLWVAPEERAGMPTRTVSRHLEAARAQLAAHEVAVTLAVRRGDAVQKILAVAKVDAVDLIALTTHGRSGLEKVEFGSVTEEVLRLSLVPLLVLRTAAVPDSFADLARRNFRRQRGTLRVKGKDEAVAAGPGTK